MASRGKELMATLVKSAMIRTNLSKKRPAPSVFFMPGLGSPGPNWSAIMKGQHAQIGDALTANYSIILEEYKNLRSLAKQTATDSGASSSSDYQVDDQKLHTGSWDWQSYLLKGQRQASFAANCPQTTEILESLTYRNNNTRKALMTGTPLSFAFFSTMGAGAEIKPHYGACNLRIRCHFPLIVPHGDVGMECGGAQIAWTAGQPLFFDDAFEHRVWNRTQEERVVLLFDLWHPELEQEEVAALQDMFGYAREQGWTKEGAVAAAQAREHEKR